MGLDRPGITPAPRKVVRKKAAPTKKIVRARPQPVISDKTTDPTPPPPKADTGDILRETTPAARRAIPHAPAITRTRKAVTRTTTVRGRKVTATADTGNILAGHGQPSNAERRRASAARFKEGDIPLYRSSAAAPILAVLDQTTRPLHAIANEVDTIVQGRATDPGALGDAALRGLRNEDKTTFGKVLKDAGASKTVQKVGGLPLDIAADPTTYVTFGAGSVARKAVTQAARDAAPKGLTVKFAGHEVPGIRAATGHTVGRVARVAATTPPARAVKRMARDVNPNIPPEGVSKATWDNATSAARTARATTARKAHDATQYAVAIRKALGGHDQVVHDAIEAKTIGSLPAHLQAPARLLERHYADIRAQELAAGIKGGTVAEVHPVVVPARTDVAASVGAVAKARRARVAAERDHQALMRDLGVARGRAQVLSRNVGGATAERRAEAQTVASGSGPQYAGGGHGVTQAANRLQQSGGRVTVARRAQAAAEDAHAATLAESKTNRVLRRRAEAHNAVAATAPKSYVPHFTTESLAERAPSEVRGSVGKRTIRPVTSRARAADRQVPLSALRVEHPGVYNEDAALAYANRMSEGHRAVAQAHLNHRLAQLGRPYRAGQLAPDSQTEGVFELVGSDLREITDKAELHRLQTRTGGGAVILNRDVVKHAHAISAPGGERSATGQAYDKVQGVFKAVAIATPGYHTRNFVGDTGQTYLGQAGYRLPGNFVRSGKTLRALKRSEESQRTLGATPKPMRGSVTINGRQMTYEQLAQEAAHVGAIRSGYQNRELSDLLHGTAQGVKKVKDGSRVVRAVKRTAQSREDLPRLATYIDARRRGLDPEAASRYAAQYHFDYANLTGFERKTARRALPFYTFSARNIPLQARTLVTKPGKFAAYQKIREEVSNSSGQKPGWESNLSPWEARNAPIAVRIGGKTYTISAGLPLTDLNEVPTTANPVKLGDEYLSKVLSLVTPVLKDPLEIQQNHSFFFRDKIKRDSGDLVAAPSFVSHFPDWAKREFHIVPDLVDKQTGKKGWGWSAYANYAAHVIPGLPSAAIGLSDTGHDRAGRGVPQKLMALGGLKATPVDAPNAAISDAYDKLGKIQDRLAELSQRGIKGNAANAERVKLNAQSRALERRIYQLTPPGAVKPAAGKPRSTRQPSVPGGIGSGGVPGGLTLP